MESLSNYEITQADYDALSDAELDEIGMYRCECGTAIYPNGDPDWRHCSLGDRPAPSATTRDARGR